MKFLHRTWAEINMKALEQNMDAICRYAGTRVYAVVKADAYGHGAVPVAKALEKKAYGFAVSNLEEALQLRQAGIKKPILILGYTPASWADTLAKQHICQCVYSQEYAQALNRHATAPISVHLKLDTGMGRIGFDCRDAQSAGLAEAKTLLDMKNLRIEGVFSHFAVADIPEQEDFTQAQYRRFVAAVEQLEKEGFSFSVKHCGNSAGLLTLPLEKCDAVRAGIMLYGLTPATAMCLPEEFAPVMSLHSVISFVKTLAPGQSVSYGRTYIADEPRRIATVSAGYADGVPRLLSNNGYVLIHGKRAPVVGRICMDQFCVDVTDIPQVKMGDTVTVFGEGLPVEEVAQQAQTISYEIICGVSERVTRIYCKNP